VSLLTVLFLAATIVFHCLTGLSPRLNIVLNSALFSLWGMGFGMLSYFMAPTLGHYCNTSTWENDAGVMVCRIYKTLFTFTLLGLYVSTSFPCPSIRPRHVLIEFTHQLTQPASLPSPPSS